MNNPVPIVPPRAEGTKEMKVVKVVKRGRLSHKGWGDRVTSTNHVVLFGFVDCPT